MRTLHAGNGSLGKIGNERVSVSDRPNILILMTDQQRFDALGCVGNDRIRTPSLGRLAASGGPFCPDNREGNQPLAGETVPGQVQAERRPSADGYAVGAGVGESVSQNEPRGSAHRTMEEGVRERNYGGTSYASPCRELSWRDELCESARMVGYGNAHGQRVAHVVCSPCRNACAAASHSSALHSNACAAASHSSALHGVAGLQPESVK